MAFTKTEIMRRYRQKFYEKGYSQLTVWVKKDVQKIPKLDQEKFLKKFDKLTASWGERELSRLYNLFLRIADAREEASKKKDE